MCNALRLYFRREVIVRPKSNGTDFISKSNFIKATKFIHNFHNIKKYV